MRIEWMDEHMDEQLYVSTMAWMAYGKAGT